MSEITDYTVEVVERAKTFGYDELYDDEESFGACPACGRRVVERAWFYRCVEDPPREEDCPMRFWKDVSGRYLDKGALRTLLAQGHSGDLDGFTARNGRTYRGVIELDEDEWKLRVRSLGWNEDATSDQPEYEVNPEPLGRCPFEEECQVVESPMQFVCERKLKEAELSRDEIKKRREEGAPQSCGFVLPRTVCKREITRDEALYYLREGKTELLTDFTSRFGRPFSATLVLKENGRHGFEFPPRKRAGEDGDSSGSKGSGASAGPKAASGAPPRKKTTRKKTVRKKAAAKSAARKKTTRKKVAKRTRKKASRKGSAGTGATRVVRRRSRRRKSSRGDD